MTYIYDIIVNFNSYAFPFYDWNDNDILTHIKKIPVFKISESDYDLILDNEIEFDNSFLNKVKDKTQTYKKNLEYAFTLCTDTRTLVLKIDKEKCYKSRMLLDEEDDTINRCSNYNIERIKYKVKTKKSLYDYLTRSQVLKLKKTHELLESSYKSKDYDTLKYLYYDCFNKKSNNIKMIINELEEEIIKNDQIINKINNFYNLLKIKNNVY